MYMNKFPCIYNFYTRNIFSRISSPSRGSNSCNCQEERGRDRIGAIVVIVIVVSSALLGGRVFSSSGRGEGAAVLVLLSQELLNFQNAFF